MNARLILTRRRSAFATPGAADAGLDVLAARGSRLARHARAPDAAVTRDDVAEIIFTSGATAEPKGVVITHRNLLANIVPVEREVVEVPQVRAAVLADPFSEPAAAQPHVRPVDGDVHPADARRHGRLHPQLQPARHRPADQDAPRVGAGVRAEDSRRAARARAARVSPAAAAEPAAGRQHFAAALVAIPPGAPLFGCKFWASSSAPRRSIRRSKSSGGGSGFVVVQGYGLTETAPIVTLNHPFSASRGSVGKPIARRRGEDRRRRRDSGARRERHAGLLQRGRARPREAFEDGWFHTGDIGEVDADGRLFIRGRKKEMIVTPEGLNVFPEDVERAMTRSARRAGRRPSSGCGRDRRAGACGAGARARHQSRGDRPRGERAAAPISRGSAASRCGPGASCRAPRARAS